MKHAINFILLFVSWNLTAQISSLSISVSSTEVHENELIKVDITLENSNGKLEAPAFSQFIVVSGPNTSSQMSIFNGKTTQKQEYSYLIKPSKTGNLFIEECFLKVGEEEYSLQGIEVSVDPPKGPSESRMNISYTNTYTARIDLNSGEKSSTKAPESKRKIKRI